MSYELTRRDTRPDVHLDIHDGSQANQIGQAIPQLEGVLRDYSPHLVLVIGDANAAAAGALAAAMTGYPVCHVEAGTRSSLHMPEETNRVLIDSISTVFCCSTKNAITNLRAEGVSTRVHLTGDLLAETSAKYTPMRSASTRLLNRYSINHGEYAFITLHRAENTDNNNRLASFADALQALPLPAVFSAHPRTRAALIACGLWESLEAIPQLRILPPVSYVDTLGLLNNAACALSDSSGIQREAYCLGIPCLILREVTEYPDLVQSGAGALVGVDHEKIREVTSELMRQPREIPRQSLLGKNNASSNIADVVAEYLNS